MVRVPNATGVRLKRHRTPVIVLLSGSIFALAATAAPPVAVAVSVAVGLAVMVAAATVIRFATGADEPGQANWRFGAMFGALALLSSATAMLGQIAPWWAGPLGGALVAAATFAAFDALWLAPVRAIMRLKRVARDPERRDAAAGAIVLGLERSQPTSALGKKRLAVRALAATGALMDASCFDHAAAAIGLVDPASLDGDLRAAVFTTRASIALHRGLRDAAFAALKEAATSVTSRELSDVLLINDAILEAQDGRGDESLERLSRVGALASPRLERSWKCARAHALAAKGEHDAAEAIVRELAQGGPDALARAAHLPGPAQALFQAALARACEGVSAPSA